MSTATQANGAREAALSYIGRQWPVFPLHSIRDGRCTCGKPECDSPGKHPLTEHGFKDATTDRDQIRDWWDRWPWANVGIRTGPESGLIGLDLDPRNGAEVSLESVEGEHGPLPDTIESETGGGGRHVLYALRNGETLPSRSNALGPGLDVKCEGGYLVAPPSLHASGRRYVWEGSHDPDETELVTRPDWMARQLRNGNGQGGPVEPAPPRDLADPGEGNRHNTLRDLTMKLSGTLPEPEVLEVARALAGRWGMQGRDGEVERMVRGAFEKAEPGEPVTLRALDLAKLLTEEMEPVPWALLEWVAKGDAVVLCGDGGIGKSWLALALGIALATGGEFLGIRVRGGPYTVLVIDEENTPRLIRYRIRKLAHGLGLSPEDVGRLPIRYLSMNSLNLDDEERLQALFAVCREFRPDFIIIDSLIRVHRRDENVNSEMAGFFAEVIQPLRSHFGCGVVMLHHLAKPPNTGNRSIEYRLRGASEIRNYPDQVWGLEKEDGTLLLKHVKSRWGEAAEALAVTIEDVDDGDGTVLRADNPTARTVQTARELLTEAGTHGVLRKEVEGRIGKQNTTRALGRLYGEGRVKKKQDGNAMRYWLTEHAPGGAE